MKLHEAIDAYGLPLLVVHEPPQSKYPCYAEVTETVGGTYQIHIPRVTAVKNPRWYNLDLDGDFEVVLSGLETAIDVENWH